jgi:membrane protein
MKHVQHLIHWVRREEWIRDIFRIQTTHLPEWQRRILFVVRRLLSSWLRFRDSRSAIQVGSLSYLTLISLVPVLAFSFSIVKTLGLHQQLQNEVIDPTLDQWVPVDQAPELRSGIEQVLLFVESTDVSSLGVIGLLTLGYAVIRMLGAVELAMNDLWGVRHARPFMRKLADYLSVAILVPILLLIAGTTSHWVDSIQSILGVWSAVGLKLIVLMFLWSGFGLLYYLLPNTRVQFGAAWRGGVLGGSIWFVIHYALLGFQVGVAGYNAIYAGFAAVPVLMLWTYGGWWAIIIGATFAAGHQMSEQHRRLIIGESASLRYQELLAVRLMVALGHQYTEFNTCLGIEQFTDQMLEEQVVVDLVIEHLERSKLVVRSHKDELVLARSIEVIRLRDILNALKIEEDDSLKGIGLYGEVSQMESQTDVDSIQELLQEVDQAWADHASNHTLQTLCERLENPMQQEDSSTLRLQPVESGQTADVDSTSNAG